MLDCGGFLFCGGFGVVGCVSGRFWVFGLIVGFD